MGSAIRVGSHSNSGNQQPATDYCIGRLVCSTQGRDSGKFYLVVGIESGTMVYVADGEERKVEKPKKKNLRHLKFYNSLAVEVADKAGSGKNLSNADVRKAIKTLLDILQE